MTAAIYDDDIIGAPAARAVAEAALTAAIYDYRYTRLERLTRGVIYELLLYMNIDTHT